MNGKNNIEKIEEDLYIDCDLLKIEYSRFVLEDLAKKSRIKSLYLS